MPLACGCYVALIPSDRLAAGWGQRPYVVRCAGHAPSLCARRRARLIRRVNKEAR